MKEKILNYRGKINYKSFATPYKSAGAVYLALFIIVMIILFSVSCVRKDYSQKCYEERWSKR